MAEKAEVDVERPRDCWSRYGCNVRRACRKAINPAAKTSTQPATSISSNGNIVMAAHK